MSEEKLKNEIKDLFKRIKSLEKELKDNYPNSDIGMDLKDELEVDVNYVYVSNDYPDETKQNEQWVGLALYSSTGLKFHFNFHEMDLVDEVILNMQSVKEIVEDQNENWIPEEEVSEEEDSDEEFEYDEEETDESENSDSNIEIFSFINSTGETLYKLSYDYIKEYTDKIAIILRKDQWGIVKLSGETIIPFGKYYSIGIFNQGYSVVSEGEDEDNLLDGLIDLNGNLILSCQYKLKDFGDGLVPFQNENTQLWGFMDLNRKVVIAEQFEDVKSFSDGMATVCKNEKWGAINASGELVIEYKYDDFNLFSSGIACVDQDGDCFYIDKKGIKITEACYDFGGKATNGTAIVRKNGKAGMINTSGQEILSCVYEGISLCSDGLIPVKVNGLWGFVDVSGKKVIDFQFQFAGPFKDGLSNVNLNGRWVFIDKTGNIKLDLMFSWTEGFENGLAIVTFD